MKFATVYPFRVPKDSMQCVYCDASFKRGGVEFRQHMKKEHKVFDRRKALAYTSEDLWLKLDCTEITCRLCNISCSTLQEIAQHLNAVHCARLKLDKSLDILPYIYHEDKIQCGICLTNHLSLRQLGLHLPSHFNKFTCEVCGKSFIYITNMKKHLLMCSNKDKYACRKCKVEFDSPQERNAHIKQNEECWPYRCDYCWIRLHNPTTKRRHLAEAHNKQLSETCPECKEVFYSHTQFLKHFKTVHKNFLPCPYCNKSFAFKKSLNRHVFTHSGEKPYNCLVCDKAFGRNSHLQQHMQIHNKNKLFECSLCERKFNQRASWKTHMKSRHPDLSIT